MFDDKNKLNYQWQASIHLNWPMVGQYIVIFIGTKKTWNNGFNFTLYWNFLLVEKVYHYFEEGYLTPLKEIAMEKILLNSFQYKYDELCIICIDLFTESILFFVYWLIPVILCIMLSLKIRIFFRDLKG